MATQKESIVVGVFKERDRAQQAVDELKRAGFRDDQIGVAGRGDKDWRGGIEEQGSYAEEGAATGAIAGAGIGGLWALGIAAGFLPAIGPVIAGGILASILASAATGAAVGVVAGALIGMGIPEEEAEYYESEFQAGRTIVTVKPEGRDAEAIAILQRNGAYDARRREEGEEAESAAMAAGWRTGAESGRGASGRTMQLKEEELQVTKEPVEVGEVRVHKEVGSEHKTVDVPVRKEEIVIERHPVTGQQAAASEIREGEEIRIPVTEEQVHVEKHPVVKEEVTVGKREAESIERVGGTVRKEEVRVEKKGDVNVERK
jgi:uncharacterized protein (TIGR02271 family)